MATQYPYFCVQSVSSPLSESAPAPGETYGWPDDENWEANLTIGEEVYSFETGGGDRYSFFAASILNEDRIQENSMHYRSDGSNLILVSNDYATWTCLTGEIKTSGGNPISGVTLSGINEVTANNGRYYKFKYEPIGLTITPSKEGWIFSPEQVVYDGLIQNSIQDFVATPSLEKPINPTPDDDDTGIDQETGVITWENGGGATSYDIYFGIRGSGLTLLAEQQAVTSWKTPLVKLYIKDYDVASSSGYRSPRAGDVLINGDNTFYIYGVDVRELVNVSRYAILYAFRTGPGEMNGGETLSNGVTPNVDNPQAVNVTLNDTVYAGAKIEEPFYPPGVTLQWRIDARDD